MAESNNLFNPDFNHRLNSPMDRNNSPLRLYDNLEPILDRIGAIAELMEVVFQEDEANNIKNLWRSAESTRFEALDAKAILKAYLAVCRAISLNDGESKIFNIESL